MKNGTTKEKLNTKCYHCKKLIKNTKLQKRRMLKNKWYCINCYNQQTRKIIKEQERRLLEMKPEDLIRRVQHELYL